MNAIRYKKTVISEIDQEATREAIEALRKKSGKSLRAVAIASGYSPAFLCDLRAGKRNYNQENAPKILAAIRSAL